MTTPEAAFATINALRSHIEAASPEPARVRVIEGVQYVRGDIAEGIATQAQAMLFAFWEGVATNELAALRRVIAECRDRRGYHERHRLRPGERGYQGIGHRAHNPTVEPERLARLEEAIRQVMAISVSLLEMRP